MNEITLIDPASYVLGASSVEEAKNNLTTYAFDIGQAVKQGDPDSMWEGFIALKEAARLLGQPIMPLQAWMVMGLTEDDAKAILRGDLYKDKPEIRDVVRKAKTYVMANMEQAALDKKIDTTVLIWYQKNFAGMSDLPEPVKIEVSETDVMTPQEIAEKYKDILE